jgi:hypothetical protein
MCCMFTLSLKRYKAWDPGPSWEYCNCSSSKSILVRANIKLTILSQPQIHFFFFFYPWTLTRTVLVYHFWNGESPNAVPIEQDSSPHPTLSYLYINNCHVSISVFIYYPIIVFFSSYFLCLQSIGWKATYCLMQGAQSILFQISFLN